MKKLTWPYETMQFPDPNSIPEKFGGLVAAGGDLSTDRLKSAYRLGIFPFYEDLKKTPILWWSPATRAVIFSDKLHISRSLKRILAKGFFSVTFDQAFDAVITGCAQRPETWITAEMKQAYLNLHHEGLAHSVEVWHEGHLAGGLYGVALGRIFFAESMFKKVSNASKVAMACLAKHLRAWGFSFFDCQFQTDHLRSMGAIELPRVTFLNYLKTYVDQEVSGLNWHSAHLTHKNAYD